MNKTWKDAIQMAYQNKKSDAELTEHDAAYAKIEWALTELSKVLDYQLPVARLSPIQLNSNRWIVELDNEFSFYLNIRAYGLVTILLADTTYDNQEVFDFKPTLTESRTEMGRIYQLLISKRLGQVNPFFELDIVLGELFRNAGNRLIYNVFVNFLHSIRHDKALVLLKHIERRLPGGTG